MSFRRIGISFNKVGTHYIMYFIISRGFVTLRWEVTKTEVCNSTVVDLLFEILFTRVLKN